LDYETDALPTALPRQLVFVAIIFFGIRLLYCKIFIILYKINYYFIY